MTPASPTDLIATAGFRMAVVTWTPPADDGGSPITSYTVSTTVGLDTISVVVRKVTGAVTPALQAVVPGLTNGTAYTFSVVATNADGDSAPSTLSSSVTPRPLPGVTGNILTHLMGQMAQDYGNYLPDSQVPEFQIGKSWLRSNSDGPRIVFVPRGGTWQGGTMLGNGIDAPLQIWDRRLVFQAHIWGVQLPTADTIQDTISNYGVAEELMTNLCASLHRIAPGSTIEESEAFPDSDGSNSTRGAAIVLNMMVETPVTDYFAPDDIVAVTEFPVTPEIVPE